jgi:hypothetical protein
LLPLDRLWQRHGVDQLPSEPVDLARSSPMVWTTTNSSPPNRATNWPFAVAVSRSAVVTSSASRPDGPSCR